MLFKIQDKLISLQEASLAEYRIILSGLDWTFFQREDPTLFTQGELAIREAYLVAETRGPEWQEVFSELFRQKNPQAIPPAFRPVEMR